MLNIIKCSLFKIFNICVQIVFILPFNINSYLFSGILQASFSFFKVSYAFSFSFIVLMTCFIKLIVSLLSDIKIGKININKN